MGLDATSNGQGETREWGRTMAMDAQVTQNDRLQPNNWGYKLLPHALSPTPSDWILYWQHLLAAHCTVLDLACGAVAHLRHLRSGGLVTRVDRNAEALAPWLHLGEMLPADLENGPWPFSATPVLAVIVTNYLCLPRCCVRLTAWPRWGAAVRNLCPRPRRLWTPQARQDHLAAGSCSACVLAGTSWRTAWRADQPDPARVVQRIAAVRPASDAADTLRPLQANNDLTNLFDQINHCFAMNGKNRRKNTPIQITKMAVFLLPSAFF